MIRSSLPAVVVTCVRACYCLSTLILSTIVKPQIQRIGQCPRLNLGRGTPPPEPGKGVPPCPGQVPGWGGVPQLEQHSVYLLRGGRYAFCVQAGGPSCLLVIWADRLQA